MIQYIRQQNRFSSSFFSLFPSLSGGFTTRDIGDCRKVQTIQKYLIENELECKKIVTLEQIHSINIAFSKDSYQGKIEHIAETDGVLTSEKNVCLCIRTADCVPVLYFDPITKLIAASHQGWRGTLKQMVVRMIEAMIKKGSNVENIYMIIGPYINACCYDIDLDRFVLFMDELERFENKAFIHFGELYHVNLGIINYELAKEVGVQQSHIDFFPFCTACDSQRFFSYRRYKQKKDTEFGEMLTYIIMQ